MYNWNVPITYEIVPRTNLPAIQNAMHLQDKRTAIHFFLNKIHLNVVQIDCRIELNPYLLKCFHVTLTPTLHKKYLLPLPYHKSSILLSTIYIPVYRIPDNEITIIMLLF